MHYIYYQYVNSQTLIVCSTSWVSGSPSLLRWTFLQAPQAETKRCTSVCSSNQLQAPQSYIVEMLQSCNLHATHCKKDITCTYTNIYIALQILPNVQRLSRVWCLERRTWWLQKGGKGAKPGWDKGLKGSIIGRRARFQMIWFTETDETYWNVLLSSCLWNNSKSCWYSD